MMSMEFSFSPHNLTFLSLGTRHVIHDVKHLNISSHSKVHHGPWLAWWFEHRTAFLKAWDRCPMPPNNLPVHTEYVHVKSMGQKVLRLNQEFNGLENISLPSISYGKIVGVEIGVVAIYRPFGESQRANSYCHLYSV
ncbi:hypothetical protein TNCV_3907551 [Trichonephila clavipes]|nr:hypothetical protein TNCV_3907551 [Trichonephila clavipes]